MSYDIRPEGDVNRLPKWAQKYIGRLTDEIERQNQHIAEISSEHPGSNVILDTKVGRPDVTLPPDSGVRFYMGDSRERSHELIEVHHLRQRKGLLEVTAYGGQLVVLPRVSNGVSLRMEGH